MWKDLLKQLAMCALLSGCGTKSVDQPELQPFSIEQAQDTRQAAAKWIGDSGQALYICGQSDGVGMFTMQWDKGFQSDGIKDGRHVFILGPDGKANIVFRDAAGTFVSASEDSCQVERINEGQLESWIVSCPSTGVTETHNITKANGQLVDLWTSSKPTSLVGASAKLFKAQCVRG